MGRAQAGSALSPFTPGLLMSPSAPVSRQEGNPESLSNPSTAQPRLPAPGWQEGILTFLKPGQVEGAGDVDSGAGAPVGPAGIHVKGPVAEQPFRGQGQEQLMVRCWWHSHIEACHPSASEGADATLKLAQVPHTSLSPPGHPSPGYPI